MKSINHAAREIGGYYLVNTCIIQLSICCH